MQIILYAIPGFIALILAEWIYGLVRGHNTYRIADTITSISLGSISRLRGLVFLGLGAWFYQQASGDYHLFDLPDSGPGIWIFALIAYDFSYYWFHRVSHEVNPFWANFHVYWSVLLDSWRTERWSDKLRVWFRGPGWRPADVAVAYPAQKTDLEHFHKFDPPAPLSARLYAFYQFVCSTLATTGLLVVAGQWKADQVLIAVALIGLAFYSQAWFTEGRRFAVLIEGAKLLLVFLAADFLPLGNQASLVTLLYLFVSLLFLVAIYLPKPRVLAG